MKGKLREMTLAMNDTFTRTAVTPPSRENGTIETLGASTEAERYAINKAKDKTARTGNMKIRCFARNLGTSYHFLIRQV
jgi:hypothetical protein